MNLAQDFTVLHIPNYLKVHLEEAAAAAAETPTATLGSLCEILAESTGWPIESADDGLKLGAGKPAAGRGRGRMDRPHVDRLLDSVNQLHDTLRETRQALREREAELAAGVPVASRPEAEHLLERLVAVLKGGAEAVGCQAAALYLLDDDTRQLKLRSCWGLPEQRLLDPPRPLRGAAADLEALVGHAVVLEDTRLLPHWKAPEAELFGAAVCVPVSSSTTLLGTLWLFATEPRDFSEHETNIIEVVAGRLASDLERETLLVDAQKHRQLRSECDQLSNAQVHQLPRIAPLLDDWQVAGWTAPRSEITGDFFDWSVLPDGRLALAAGRANKEGLPAAIGASCLMTALRAHGSYRHNARQMIARLNETLWTTSAGDQFASIFYALIDPDTGRLQHSSAGKTGALLHVNDVEPLMFDALPLGTQPDDTFDLREDYIPRGGGLLIVSEGLLPLCRSVDGRPSALSLLLQQEELDAEALAEGARRLMLDRFRSRLRDCTIVIARRA